MKSSKELYPSLVGSSIEFRFGNDLNQSSLAKNISSAKKIIARDIESAFSVGGELCVMLLAELTSFYSKESYYMAVRGSISMRRYRPMVLEYLEQSVDERAERLKKVLSEKIRGDRHRDIKVEALRYFLATYTSRIKEFKSLLTKSEYLIVV